MFGNGHVSHTRSISSNWFCVYLSFSCAVFYWGEETLKILEPMIQYKNRTTPLSAGPKKDVEKLVWEKLVWEKLVWEKLVWEKLYHWAILLCEIINSLFGLSQCELSPKSPNFSRIFFHTLNPFRGWTFEFSCCYVFSFLKVDCKSKKTVYINIILTLCDK